MKKSLSKKARKVIEDGVQAAILGEPFVITNNDAK
jgi:hypothetical protein